MVQKDVHRLSVPLLLGGAGKRQDTRWFIVSLRDIVKGGNRQTFFPCCGNGNGTSRNNRGSNGNYWSSSLNSQTNGRNLNFNSGGVNPQNNNNRFNGFVGRAVQHSILGILSFTDDTHTSAVIIGLVCCLLFGTETQGGTVLRKEMGVKSETEHGGTVRRPLLSEVQTSPFEMLHSGLSEEEGDLRSDVQGQNSTPSVFQLYAQPVREDVHTGLLLVHQGAWHTLWYRTYNGYVSERVTQLAEEVLCDAPRHQRLLYAHRQVKAAGDCCCQSEEDVHTSYQQRYIGYMGRYSRHGIRRMADGNYRSTESERELHHLWRPVRLGWAGPSKEYVATGRRHWTSHWQSYEPTLLKCVSKSVRPIHETRIEVSLLWALCGRCSGCECKQRMAIESGAKDKAIPESGARTGFAYRETCRERGASWCRVPWGVHKAVPHVHVTPLPHPYGGEDSGYGLLEAMEGDTQCELLSRYHGAYVFIQDKTEDVPQARVSENRTI